MIKPAVAEVKLDREPFVKMIDVSLEIDDQFAKIIEAPSNLSYEDVLAFWVDGVAFEIKFLTDRSYQILQ